MENFDQLQIYSQKQWTAMLSDTKQYQLISANMTKQHFKKFSKFENTRGTKLNKIMVDINRRFGLWCEINSSCIRERYTRVKSYQFFRLGH